MATRIFFMAAMLLAPLSAGAVYLDYTVDDERSEFFANVEAEVTLTYVVGPTSVTLNPGGVTEIPLSGSVAVDTGLPDNFDNGANGIELKALDLYATALPGESLVTFTDSSLLGGVFPVSLTASITAVSVAFAPTVSISDVLAPSGSVDEYLWGPVDGSTVVTLHGSLKANVSGVPSGSVSLTVWDSTTDGPIVGAASVPYEGRFWGDKDGTVVTLMADVPDIPLSDEGNSGGYYSWEASILISKIEAGALATNPTTIPEPSAGLMGAMACLSLAMLRGRRGRRAA